MEFHVLRHVGAFPRCPVCRTDWLCSLSRRAEQRLKYAELASSNSNLFFPVSIETLGIWGPSAAVLCRDIGSRLVTLSGYPRSHHFLIQRLALAVQRGNASSVAGTHPSQLESQ